MKTMIFSLVIVLMLVMTACSCATTTVHVLQESNGVQVQLAMILDGSGSIDSGEWNIMVTGLAQALNNTQCVPHDGSIELTVIVFAEDAKVGLSPVVVTDANAADVVYNITNLSRSGIGTYTCISCGLCLAADTLAASPYFDPSLKQAVNLVTDGDPNRCSCTLSCNSSQRSPTSNTGAFSNPTNAYDDGGGYAQAENGQVHQYYGYNFSAIPDGAAIQGVEVRMDAWRQSGQSGSIAVELSWDGGTSWTTTGYSASLSSNTGNIVYSGGPSDTWGRNWTASEVKTGLRVRLNVTSTSWVRLDWVPVTVYYGDPAYSCGYQGSSSGCDGQTSAECAREYLLATLNMTEGQDEIDAEGIGIMDANRDWLKNNIIFPATGYSNPPESWPPPAPGWVRVFATFEEFVPSLCEKFEFVVYGSITVHKFNDLNGDGDQDGGEDDLSGWTMTLYSGPDCSGSPLASNETNADGHVVFSGLEAGTYSVEETLEGGWTNSTALCQQVTIAAGESTTLNFGNLCISPTAAFNATPTSGCEPSLIVTFTDQSTGSPTSWNWSFPGGTPSSHTGQTPPTVTYDSAGSYDVTLIVSNTCGSDTETKTNYITVYTKPTATASSNSPVCEGTTIELYGGPDGMTSYSWTGPNDFSSSSQNPTIPNATTLNAGTYYLTVTDGGCTSDPASTVVVVNTKPTASASSNSPICEGATIELYGGPDGMTSYSWSGPGGWTSTDQNPTRTGATTDMAGTYTVTVTNSNGCTDDETTSVTVNTKPTATASSNSPVCEGATIELHGGPNGMTSYSWTGPGGWTSSSQNPTRTGATTAMAGTYTLTVTNGGCTDDESTSVTVNTKPTATASSNSPVCEGATIELYGGPDGMTSYSWTGPGGWTSSSQNPTRTGATTAMAGTYTLTVTNSNGCTDDESTGVTVNTKPTATASSNSPVCEGATIELHGGPNGMTSYSWTGPGGWTSSSQNPTRTGATTAMAGTYTLIVTNSNGCADDESTSLTVNTKPTADAGADREIPEGSSVVIGGSPTASGGTPPYTYSWTPTTGLNDGSIANPTASPAVNTTYTVTVTDSKGCTDSDDATVTLAHVYCICGFVYRAGTTEALAGWEVILEKKTNPWLEVQRTFTDADGKYCFCGLENGEYRVSEVVKSGWNQVSPVPNQYIVTLPGDASDPEGGPFRNFENTYTYTHNPSPPLTVGWEASPIDKLAVLAPWIALFAVIAAGASLLVLGRRGRGAKHV
jgi:PKD repeat protein